MTSLLDANVLLDIFTEDEDRFDWSANALADAVARGPVAINPIIYAEVAAGFDTVEALNEALSGVIRLDLPYDAGFLAARCLLRYRRAGGVRRSPLPDFYIGAHAAVEGLDLITRDGSRYRTYFPSLIVVSPD